MPTISQWSSTSPVRCHLGGDFCMRHATPIVPGAFIRSEAEGAFLQRLDGDGRQHPTRRLASAVHVNRIDTRESGDEVGEGVDVAPAARTGTHCKLLRQGRMSGSSNGAHGGNGSEDEAGRARIAEAQRLRWRSYREWVGRATRCRQSRPKHRLTRSLTPASNVPRPDRCRLRDKSRLLGWRRRNAQRGPYTTGVAAGLKFRYLCSNMPHLVVRRPKHACLGRSVSSGRLVPH
jgi:hypothetical protein